MKQFFCELLFICSAAVPGAQPIDELTYGTILFDYYQQDYQAALLNTLVSERRGYQGENPVRFDLAKGSFAFADGMYSYASDIFAAVPDTELTDLDQMRLAFHLAREFHRRQDWQPLAEQLAKIELGKSWLGKRRTHPEVQYMRAELAVTQGDFSLAQKLYDQMDETSALRAYGLFNLGVTYREQNMLDAAKRTFRGLAKMPVYDDEAYDLSQRARLALALISRQQEDPTRAEHVLAELPSEGRYQDVAMAAYGGLAMDTENYELAARIWMTLQEQQYWTPSTATARLGFPLSLEKMALNGQRATTEMALLQYREAETSFDNRLTSLTALVEAANDPGWVHGLLEVFALPSQTDADGEVDPAHRQRMQDLMQRWQSQLGHTDWLEWLATDNVHQVLVQWRELSAMDSWLQAMPPRLQALQTVATEQSRRTVLARELLAGDGVLAQRAELEQQIQQSAAAIAVVEGADAQPELTWMYPLATAEERELLSELQTMSRLVPHMSARDQRKWQARIDRLRGVVFYQIVDQRAERERALHKSHQQLVELLAGVDDRIQRVQAAENEFVAGVGTDFTLFVDRADALTQRISQARASREGMLAAEIRDRMREEMARVQQYLLVTRIAIARATDQLALNADG